MERLLKLSVYLINTSVRVQVIAGFALEVLPVSGDPMQVLPDHS